MATKKQTKQTNTTDPAVATWAETLRAAARKLDTAAVTAREGNSLVWLGGAAAIADVTSGSDYDGIAFYEQVLGALGQPRKGTASKLRTVADAVVEHGLDTSEHKSLAAAYNAARALNRTRTVEVAEDTALDEALSALIAPKSTSTIEGAAKLLLSKGEDEAVRQIFDAIGGDNFAALRSFVRAATQELSGRVKASQEAAKKEAAAKAAKKRAKAKAAQDKQDKKSGEKKAPVRRASGIRKAPAKKVEPEQVEQAEPEQAAKPAHQVRQVRKPRAKAPAPKAEPELENTEPTLDGGEAPAPRVARRVVRRPAAKGRPVTRRA